MFRTIIDAKSIHACAAMAEAGNRGIPDRCVRMAGRWYFCYR